MPCYSPLKGYKDSETGGLVFKRSRKAEEKMEVACSQCLGCRLDRSRMWAMRITHEASLYEYSEGNSFITLTYENEHLPLNGSLDVRDWQKFMKRLRHHLSPKKVRFYMAGEYGEDESGRIGRPHFHAIIFNHMFGGRELWKSDRGVEVYTSTELADVWQKGFVTVGEVTFQSAAYIARYTMKKRTGKQSEVIDPETGLRWYERIHPETGEVVSVNPEFSTMSRNPGIGGSWYEKYKTDVFPSDEVPVPGYGVIKGTPRFYTERLAREEPESHEEVRKLRQVFREEHESEYTPERLFAKYKVKKAQLASLRRTLE